MKFGNVLNEERGRNYSASAVNIPLERFKNKIALLNAKGIETTFNFQKDELLVAKPNGDIINIYNDTSRVRFEYVSEEARERWKKFYMKIFPNEGKRTTGYTKKDGSVNVRKEARCEPSDFIKNGYLKQKLTLNSLMSYDEFMNSLAKDIRVFFV